MNGAYGDRGVHVQYLEYLVFDFARGPSLNKHQMAAMSALDHQLTKENVMIGTAQGYTKQIFFLARFIQVYGVYKFEFLPR